MDNILLVHIKEVSLFEIYCQLQHSPELAGVLITPEKVQIQLSFNIWDICFTLKKFNLRNWKLREKYGKL